MKMRKFAGFMLAGTMLLSTLSGCGSTIVDQAGSAGAESAASSEQTQSTEDKTDLTEKVSLKINYAAGNKSRTITYNQESPLTLPDGTVYTAGMLKPMWDYVETALNCELTDITTQDQKATEMIDIASTTNFSEANIFGGNSIADDLMYYGTEGKFVNLSDMMAQGYMPNFKAYSTEGMYDVLCYLSDMEAEGLIYSDCYDLTNKTNFRSTLWGTDESEAPAYGFITFDWQASSTADSLNKDIVVVLPPVAKVNGVWQYYIDNGRAIKPDGWSISVAGCATDAELYRSCALLDYFFTEEGSTLQNYGLPMFLKENETYTGPDGKEYPQYTDWVMETCASVAKGDLSTFLRDWLGCLIPIGYQKDIGFEYQYTSERGFEGWELLQNSTTHFATYAGEGIKGDNPNYYKMVPPVFSLTLRQKEAISETTTMGMEDLSEEMFNIVRYNAKGNAPNGISIPADYNEYLAAFEARNLDAYVTAYQQAYQVMTAAQ